MPDDDKPAQSGGAVDAALSAWESGAGNTPDPALHPALARIRAQFDAHPDVCTLSRVLDAAQNDASDPVPVTVTVQPGLLALLAHIESLDAAAAARASAPPERIFNQIIGNYLVNLLHGLVTDPTKHPHYARLWNSHCAAAGAPELAVPDTAAPPAPNVTEGPF